MFANLTGWHLLIVLAIVLLIFGAAKLPALARGVGQSVSIFKGEVKSADRAEGVGTTDMTATPTTSPEETHAVRPVDSNVPTGN